MISDPDRAVASTTTTAIASPEMILLRRVLKPELIATYVGVVASGIMATGLLFNIVL